MCLIEVIYTKLSQSEPNNLQLEIKHNHQKPILIALKQSKSDFISRNLTIEHRSNGSSRFQRANVVPCFYNGYLGQRLLASLSICDKLVYNIIKTSTDSGYNSTNYIRLKARVYRNQQCYVFHRTCEAGEEKAIFVLL